uniref:Serpentine receptor class gamma n=1 Tax=Haemonchus contortus TaxID=6289 RepID=A0A7I4YT22_HAECO
MAIFSLLFYIGMLMSYIHGLLLFESPEIARLAGSNYQGSFLAFVIANLCLTVHRLFYTLLPFRSQVILTATVGKICIAFIFLFYVAYVAITLTPLACVEFCPAHFFFFFRRATLLLVVARLNELSNYAIGIVNVTAYTIMFTTLFIRGSLTFRRNSEIRMTVQAAIVSACELVFFLYWQYGPSANDYWELPEFWQHTLDGYSMLIYYDVLILPYMIFNQNVKKEIRNLFCKPKYTSPLVCSLQLSSKK